MPLQITLKPKERLFIGGAVLTNGGATCRINVINDVPILREKEILTDKTADTPCSLIYLAIQLMYMDEKNLEKYQKIYWDLVRDVMNAAPSTIFFIDLISKEILANRYYRALKQAQKLITYEKELTQHVIESDKGIRKR